MVFMEEGRGNNEVEENVDCPPAKLRRSKRKRVEVDVCTSEEGPDPKKSRSGEDTADKISFSLPDRFASTQVAKGKPDPECDEEDISMEASSSSSGEDLVVSGPEGESPAKVNLE